MFIKSHANVTQQLCIASGYVCMYVLVLPPVLSEAISTPGEE